MLSELKVWILLGAVGVMAAISRFIIKVVTAQIIKKLDEIVLELKQLTQATTIQGQQIKGLQEQDAMIHHRLNEHANRIHSLELKAIQEQ